MFKLYNYSLLYNLCHRGGSFLIVVFCFRSLRQIQPQRLGPDCQSKMGMDDNGIPFSRSYCIFLLNSRKKKFSGDHFFNIMADPLYTQDIHISFYAVGQG